MKYAVFALIAITGSQSLAMDFSGVDIREIPIRMSAAKLKERAAILQTPEIKASDWARMTYDEKVEIAQQLAVIDYLQRVYLNQEAAKDRARDERVNPQALCTATFGAEYEYGGRVERALPGNQIAASYLCTKFGPSRRTPHEKLMIQLKGYAAFVKFKIRHPLTEWPG